MLEGFLSFSNFEGYKRGGFHDVGHLLLHY